MTTTIVAPGKALTFIAPSGGVVSGQPYLIGSLLVIAAETVAQALPFEGLVLGIVDVPKVADEVWTENVKIYFDESAGLFTTDDDTAANPLVGVAVGPFIAATVLLASDALAADLLIDGLTLQVLDFAALSGATITVTIGGVATVLTEGVDFDAETSDDVTATNLAAAIDALAGAAAAAVTDTVTVTPGAGVSALTPGTGRVRLDGVAR